MKFAYYKNLTARQRRIYDRSDAVLAVRLPARAGLLPHAEAVQQALARDDRAATEAAAAALVQALLSALGLPAVRVRVLAVRPASAREELHGLYEFGGGRTRPLVTVWMRTAARRQVVAFRTFLRTLLHEVVHHLDYEMFHFEDSYHTQGFYRRAESLFDQAVPPGSDLAARTRARGAAASGTAPPGRRAAAARRTAGEKPQAPRPAARAADPAAGPQARAPRPRTRASRLLPAQPLLPFDAADTRADSERGERE